MPPRVNRQQVKEQGREYFGDATVTPPPTVGQQRLKACGLLVLFLVILPVNLYLAGNPITGEGQLFATYTCNTDQKKKAILEPTVLQDYARASISQLWSNDAFRSWMEQFHPNITVTPNLSPTNNFSLAPGQQVYDISRLLAWYFDAGPQGGQRPITDVCTALPLAFQAWEKAFRRICERGLGELRTSNYCLGRKLAALSSGDNTTGTAECAYFDDDPQLIRYTKPVVEDFAFVCTVTTQTAAGPEVWTTFVPPDVARPPPRTPSECMQRIFLPTFIGFGLDFATACGKANNYASIYASVLGNCMQLQALSELAVNQVHIMSQACGDTPFYSYFQFAFNFSLQTVGFAVLGGVLLTPACQGALRSRAYACRQGCRLMCGMPPLPPQRGERLNKERNWSSHGVGPSVELSQAGGSDPAGDDDEAPGATVATVNPVRGR